MRPVRWTCPQCKTELISRAPQNEGAQPRRNIKGKCSNCKTVSEISLEPAPTPIPFKIPTPPAFTQKKASPVAPQRKRNFAARKGFLPLTSLIALAGALLHIYSQRSPLSAWKPIEKSIETSPKETAEPPVQASADLKALARQIAELNTSDELILKAMAPERQPTSSALPIPSIQHPLFLQSREGMSDITLRRGPGADFAQIGKLSPVLQYRVKNWNGRWFEIETDENAKKTAWVHLDQVEIISEANP